MRSRLVWSVIIVAVSGGYLLSRLAAEPPKNAPIVLSYREAPIFLGPHEHWVSTIAFSPDGKTVATGSDDGYLRLWDSATGTLRSMHGDDATRGINGLAFSPDGNRVAVTGGLFGKEVVVWDPAAGRIAQEFASSAETAALSPDAGGMIYKGKPIIFRPLHGVAYSPDGQILAVAGDEVVLRDSQSGKVLATLKHRSKGVKAMAFSADGKTLVTGGNDMKLKLWSLPGGVLEETLDGPTQPLSSVAISADGKRIVAASSGPRSLLSREEAPIGFLWCWERPSGAVRKIEIGNGRVRQLAFVGSATVVVGTGRELLSFDLQAAAPRPRKVWSHSGDILSLAVSPDRHLVASGGKDRTVDVVDLSTGKLMYRLPALIETVSAVATSNDGQLFATATMDTRFSNRIPPEPTFAAHYHKYFSEDADAGRIQSGVVRIWSTRDGKQRSKLPLPACQVTAIEFIPGGQQLAIVGWTAEQGGMLSVWNLNGAENPREFATQTTEVLSIDASPDGKTIVSGAQDGNVDWWDVRSGTKKQSLKFEHPVEAVVFSADGKRLAVGDANKTVHMCDATSGAVAQTLQSSSPIESLDFSPDGNLLAAGTRHPGLELWDLRAGGPSRTLAAAGDYFETMPGFVAFSQDGRFVVCGGHGKDIAVFDVTKGTLHLELSGHYHAPTAAAFLPDGRLVSGGEERTIRLWDANLGKALATWVVVPADQKQNWSDEWVGYKPTGEFVGSENLDRLIGWQSGGDVTLGKQDGKNHRRVESLFSTKP